MTEFNPEGRDCITRNGQLAKWVGYTGDDRYPLVFEINGYNDLFTRSGRFRDAGEDLFDLVRYADEPEKPEKPEKPKGPVVTETVKLIVPGTYDDLRVRTDIVSPGRVWLSLAPGHYGADEIGKLIDHLTAIQPVLRDTLSSDGGE